MLSNRRKLLFLSLILICLLCAAAFGAPDQKTVKTVQEQLNAAGYNCGTADGLLGKKTEEAIRSYQITHHLTVNGQITEELLSSLSKANVKAGSTKDMMEDELSSLVDGLSYQKLEKLKQLIAGRQADLAKQKEKITNGLFRLETGGGIAASSGYVLDTHNFREKSEDHSPDRIAEAIVFRFSYTNKESSKKSFQDDFRLDAYQNGKQLKLPATWTVSSSLPEGINQLDERIASRETITVSMAFLLLDDSPVTLVLASQKASEKDSYTATVLDYAGIPDSSSDEAAREPETEAVSEAETEEITEAVSEAETEEITEAVSEAETEEIMESVDETERVTESVKSATETEIATEPEPAGTQKHEVHQGLGTRSEQDREQETEQDNVSSRRSAEAQQAAAAKLEEKLKEQPVKVLDVRIVSQDDPQYDSLPSDSDMLLPVIRNDSGTAVKNMRVLLAAWDDQGQPVVLRSRFMNYQEQYVVGVMFYNCDLAFGGKMNKNYSDAFDAVTVDHACRVAHVKAIVASYETYSGETWESPLAEEWTDVYENQLFVHIDNEGSADPEDADPDNSDSATGKTYQDRETIKKVQEALNAAGFACGTADGIAGQRTKAAMNSYQKQHQLTVTDQITDELLKSLKIS